MTLVMRLLRFLGLVVLLCIGLLLCGWFLIHGNWNKTYATLTDAGSLRAIVQGDTENPLTGWTSHLIWNRSDDKWYVYYLNHEAYFEKYELKKREQFIEVFCNGSLVGELDTAAAKFHHLKQNLVYEKPLDVIHRAKMEDRQKWSYWEQKDW
jgi:hypothetical protein